MKTRIAPLSAAVACTQLARLDERNARRNANLAYLSARLEPLGIHTFLPPPHVERVYFEFLVRPNESRIGLPIDAFARSIEAEGCDIRQPRYPLLHQQPFFTEGHAARVGRWADAPTYDPGALPRTTAINRALLRLPAFPSASRELLDQYALAFEKVAGAAQEIAAREPT